MPDELNSDRAVTLDCDLAGEHAREQRQVAALKGRLEIGGCGGRAPAITDSVLAAREAFGIAIAVVRNDRITGGFAGCEPGVVDRIGDARPFDAHRSIAAACVGRALAPGLAAFEVGQYVRIGPAERSLLGPAVIVAPVAARVAGHVD